MRHSQFKRADTGGIYTLTPVGLGSSVRELSLTSQALASPCGSFHISQYQHPNIGVQTDPTGDVDLPNPEGGSAGRLPCGGGGGGTPPPGSYTWVNRWHHRDHLSSLRVVTSESGSKEEGNDYYPYGLELLPDSGVIGSRSWAKFTVHTRDKQTGIDDMKMRSKPARGFNFFSIDPYEDVTAAAPYSWNRYGYVHDSPVSSLDFDGRACVAIARGEEISYDGGKTWRVLWVMIERIICSSPARSMKPGGRARLDRESLIQQAIDDICGAGPVEPPPARPLDVPSMEQTYGLFEPIGERWMPQRLSTMAWYFSNQGPGNVKRGAPRGLEGLYAR